MVLALLRRRESHHLAPVDRRPQWRNQRRAAPTVIPFRRRIQMPTSQTATENPALCPDHRTTPWPVTGQSANSGCDAARTMLDAFASVGATRFNVSWIKGYHEPRRPRTLRKNLEALGGPLPEADNEDWLDAVHIDGLSHADLSRTIPALLAVSVAERLSLIIRPFGANVMFIQLDDLTEDKLQPAAPAMFLSFETSPGNFQAWLALPGNHDKELARRGRLAAHSDKSASGATRIAGSFNFKPDYAPYFPRVTIHKIQPGRITSIEELERLGLLSPLEIAPAPASTRLHTVCDGKWPSYPMCPAGAPLNRAGTGPDRSRADYWYCFLAIDWGNAIPDTAAQLLQVSEKAQFMEKRSKGYALMTAENAAAAVERRKQPRHRA
jgi:hypothetical protein